MGYRSDICIKIYGNKEKLQQLKDKVDAELAKSSEEMQIRLDGLIDESCELLERDLWELDDEDDASFMFLVEHVKWYDGIPEVDYFNGIYKAAEEMGETDETIMGEYVRIGEELEDNTHEMFNVDDYPQLTIRRSIEY